MDRKLVVLVVCVLSCAADMCLASEKIVNSDIAKGSEGWETWARKGNPQFAVDNQVGHNDNMSLMVSTSRKGEDGSWKQSFAGGDFTTYHYDFWFKTKEPNKKITFLAEFSNPDAYLGQFRQDITSNGTDWTHAEGDFTMTFGSMVQVSLWSNLDDLDVCTVWFDDIRVQDAGKGGYIRYEITKPINRVIFDSTKSIETCVTAFGNQESVLHDCQLVLSDASGKTIAGAKAAITKQGKVIVKLPSKLPLGKHRLSATIKDKDGTVLLETADVLIRREKPLKVSIGEFDELRINGKPFFPISVYWPRVEDLKTLREGGFNSAHIGWGNDPKPFMDEAERLGMYCPMEIPEYSRGQFTRQQFIDKVQSLVKYPNLLCYYISDEPAFSSCPPSLLRDAYNIVKEHDQDRPVLYVDYMKLHYQLYRCCTDIIGTDPYEPVVNIENTILTAQTSANPGQPVWNVIGTFPSPDGTLPTKEYVRAAVYTSLAAGARGIFYFAAHFADYDMTNSVLWNEIKALNSEIDTMSKYLMGAKPKMLLEKGPVSASLFKSREGNLLVVVNKTDKPVDNVSIRVGSGNLKALFSNSSIASKGTIGLNLMPYETGAYIIR